NAGARVAYLDLHARATLVVGFGDAHRQSATASVHSIEGVRSQIGEHLLNFTAPGKYSSRAPIVFDHADSPRGKLLVVHSDCLVDQSPQGELRLRGSFPEKS